MRGFPQIPLGDDVVSVDNMTWPLTVLRMGHWGIRRIYWCAPGQAVSGHLCAAAAGTESVAPGEILTSARQRIGGRHSTCCMDSRKRATHVASDSPNGFIDGDRPCIGVSGTLNVFVMTIPAAKPNVLGAEGRTEMLNWGLGDRPEAWLESRLVPGLVR